MTEASPVREREEAVVAEGGVLGTVENKAENLLRVWGLQNCCLPEVLAAGAVSATEATICCRRLRSCLRKAIPCRDNCQD